MALIVDKLTLLFINNVLSQSQMKTLNCIIVLIKSESKSIFFPVLVYFEINSQNV